MPSINKTLILSLLACCASTLQAAPITKWKILDLDNGKGEARISVEDNWLNVQGAVRALEGDLTQTSPSLANFDYTARIKVPEQPAAWASAALTVFGKNDRERSYAMVIFNKGGKAEAGFYPDTLSPVSLKPGSILLMRLQVSEGEQRFRIWEEGSDEPAEWLASASLPFEEAVKAVGLRTYALKGEFDRPELTEGNVAPQPVIALNGEGNSLTLTQDNGTVRTMTLGGEQIDMFRGNHAGPALYLSDEKGNRKFIALGLATKMKSPLVFRAADGSMEYTLGYKAGKEAVSVTVTAQNKGSEAFRPSTLGLQLGIDTCMISYPDWNRKHFPTFLRNEKTHFWGYAMSPSGSIVGIFSPDYIPAWDLKYNNGGHRINGIDLQLMTDGKLPVRLEQQATDPGELKPGETRTWTIRLAKVDKLEDVPVTAAQLTGAAFATADRYTGEPGETVTLTLHGSPAEVSVTSPGGTSSKLDIKDGKVVYSLPNDPGNHMFSIVKDGKESSTIVTVRKPWSWYMLRSREWAVKSKQKGGSHVESWYGFFPAFDIRRLIPDAKLDKQLDEDFAEVFATMYNQETAEPLPPSHPARIQNHAGAASLYAHRYLITNNIKDLEMAADLADYVIKTQKDDGAYRSHGTHYTSVIYVAKYIMEVMDAEKTLAATDPVWKKRFDGHYASVERSIDELARNLDNIETEGEMTFEDGMISCSYTQLAAWARHYATPEKRQGYIDAAEALVSKHRCLSQLVQPDSRMHGASLRFWESQYDVLYCRNMMSSPHGWSAWRLYGLFDLYRLTGKIDYLRQAMNGMGTCANVINPQTGVLSWAFMVDPKITTEVFNPGGKITHETLGEQYIPMISTWHKAPPHTPVFAYSRDKGGSCDNDVQEIFKCLGEHALTTTWLYIDQSGKPEVWNGSVRRDGDRYVVTPSEGIVSEVHVNTLVPATVEARLEGKPHSRDLQPGLTSISR